MRFDWYQATIKDDVPAILATLQRGYGAGVTLKEGRGLHGYRQRFDLVGGDMTLASVLCGGANGYPNAWASGPETDAFQAIVRESWGQYGQHSVTRLDAAEDFQGPGSYERLLKLVRGVVKEQGVKGREIVPEDAVDGRTYYGGAPTSAVRLRLYEKGKQERAKAPRPEEIPEDWTRLEVQARPGKQGFVAAFLTPEQTWGFSNWTSTVAAKTMALDVPRVQINPWRESDDQRAYRFLLKQYGPLLERIKGDLGSWTALGAQIGYDLEQLAKDKVRTR